MGAGEAADLRATSVGRLPRAMTGRMIAKEPVAG